jgi:hypothetical protein
LAVRQFGSSAVRQFGQFGISNRLVIAAVIGEPFGGLERPSGPNLFVTACTIASIASPTKAESMPWMAANRFKKNLR